jgi:hypothetical protein
LVMPVEGFLTSEHVRSGLGISIHQVYSNLHFYKVYEPIIFFFDCRNQSIDEYALQKKLSILLATLDVAR